MGHGRYGDGHWKDNYGWRRAYSPCTYTSLLLRASAYSSTKPTIQSDEASRRVCKSQHKLAQNHRTIHVSRGYISRARLSNVYALLRSLRHTYPPDHYLARKLRTNMSTICDEARSATTLQAASSTATLDGEESVIFSSGTSLLAGDETAHRPSPGSDGQNGPTRPPRHICPARDSSTSVTVTSTSFLLLLEGWEQVQFSNSPERMASLELQEDDTERDTDWIDDPWLGSEPGERFSSVLRQFVVLVLT